MGLYITIFNNNNNVLKVILKAIKPWYYSDLEKERKNHFSSYCFNTLMVRAGFHFLPTISLSMPDFIGYLVILCPDFFYLLLFTYHYNRIYIR